MISGVMAGPGEVDDQPHWLLQVQDPSGPWVAAAPQFPHVMVGLPGGGPAGGEAHHDAPAPKDPP
ncbi:hypothetical protein EAO76_00420 [Streptomyces sp. sk2.1]|nr:hypothetical protein EAO76_00420 [Streptomyces sp. sk2.1]